VTKGLNEDLESLREESTSTVDEEADPNLVRSVRHRLSRAKIAVEENGEITDKPKIRAG
jgi:hypothetical protein